MQDTYLIMWMLKISASIMETIIRSMEILIIITRRWKILRMLQNVGLTNDCWSTRRHWQLVLITMRNILINLYAHFHILVYLMCLFRASSEFDNFLTNLTMCISMIPSELRKIWVATRYHFCDNDWLTTIWNIISMIKIIIWNVI